MSKKAKYTFGGINQDTSKSKHLPQYYFEGQHLRLISTDTQATGGISNEKGNEAVITIPAITINNTTKVITYPAPDGLSLEALAYNSSEIDSQITSGLLPTYSNTQIIIGTIDTRTGIVLFTTDDSGMDCIWYVENVLDSNYAPILLYVRNLSFSSNNLIQAIFNYENDIIQKIYWVDGRNQIRFLNLNHSIANGDLEELIDISSSTINFVGNFNLNQPIIESIAPGGNHTSGMIQYAYNLYRLNSSQTTISPLTDLVALSKGDNLGGGAADEIVGATPVIKISDIDPEYTHIKLYAVKYTGLNQVPSVSLILDREIGVNREVVHFDDGDVVSVLSLEEFLFLGSNPIIPKHIQTKDNILFSANIDQNNFNVDLDMRAFSYPSSSSTTFILDAVVPGNPPNIVPSMVEGLSVNNVTTDVIEVDDQFSNVPKKFDCVNPNYDFYKYRKNSTVRGGTGKYIEYTLLTQTPTTNPEGGLLISEVPYLRFFKANEIYRIGIIFYNRLGQKTFPIWVTDLKAPNGNLDGTYNIINFVFTTAFNQWLADDNNFESEDDRPIGYKIIRAERNIQDRSILYQGTLTPMMFQVKGEEAKDWEQFVNDIPRRREFQDTIVKTPSWATRTFENSLFLQPEIFFNSGRPANGRVIRAVDLSWLNDNTEAQQSNPDSTDGGEILRAAQENLKVSQTFQHTKMMQLWSPEILFDLGATKSGLKVKVNGLCCATREELRIKEINILTQLERNGGKFRFTPDREILEDNNLYYAFHTDNNTTNPRYIGPVDQEDVSSFLQIFREFGDFYPNVGTTTFNIYGKPEIVIDGQGKTEYNNDQKYSFINSLESFAADGNQEDCGGSQECEPLVSMNSWGNKSAVIMFGTSTTLTQNRTGLEDLFNTSTFINNPNDNGVLNVDITIPEINVYLGSLYGGNTYEDKKVSSYFEIGSYKTFLPTGNAQTIKSPGDTYVSLFKFLRIGKTQTQVLDNRVPQITEIISFLVETTVDLKNRNDLSIFDWDNRFQPPIVDYNKYNTVYSQEPALVKNIGEGSNFKEVKTFDTRIYASKVKIPGEDIDNWTDLLINEFKDIDGKYGPINSLVNFKDNLYTFQDNAIAQLSINPRVQVQGSDGISVELGTGGVFYDVNYLTTKSGSINKWGVLPTDNAIYYYDVLNRAMDRIPKSSSGFLSDEKGLHTYFNNNCDYSLLKVDNPILKSGVLFGYDNYNKDVYITLHQGDNSFTRVFNENAQEFIDKKLYYPTNYIYKGEKLFLLNEDNTTMYEQFKGKYNVYFDENIPTIITLMINPDSDLECVFDNIEYKSELYINDVDQPDKTLSHIRAWNEYQDSGRVPLIVGRDKNIRRKFRNWRALIPRNGRERIRNPWVFLQLELQNNSEAKFILHDVIVSYTV